MRSSVALVLTLCCCGSVAAEERSATREARSLGPSLSSNPRGAPTDERWSERNTANFRVIARQDQIEVVAESCERLRTELAMKWLGAAPASWRPKCVVVVHPTAESYLAELGREGQRSSGCSTIRVEENRVVGRRIDVRSDRDDGVASALPHELTHMILADVFAGRDLPRWADEGIAVLADPERKQAGRRSDLQHAIADGACFRLAELFSLESYPGSSSLAVFYGQSASLVEFLVARQSPAHFVEFVKHAGDRGYDLALREHYGISDVRELERLWRQAAAQDRASSPTERPAERVSRRDRNRDRSMLSRFD